MSENRSLPLTILVLGGIGVLDVLAAAFLAWAPMAQGWGFGQPVDLAGWHTTLGGFCGVFLGICGVSMIVYAGYIRRKLLAPNNF